MAGTSKTKNIDIAKTGPLAFRQLQYMNDLSAPENVESIDINPLIKGLGIDENYQSLYNPLLHAQQDIMSPLAGQETISGAQDYWGRSHWDNPNATGDEFSRLGDIRAENQPWYSKIINGIGKAGVTAGTTIAETAGLIYGLGQGIYDTITTDGDASDKATAWLNGLWNNPITQALQKINDASEDLMPNYYTQDEQENPFSNIFTANFLGDKIIKNLGFMVGAFYAGIPAAKGLGKLGINAVKGAREEYAALRSGMARKVWDLRNQAARTGEKLDDLLAANHLTQAERGAVLKEGLDKIDKIAEKTRTVTQHIGALGSALNEGAIEAINNSRDWARTQRRMAYDRIQQEMGEEINAARMQFGGTEMEEPIIQAITEKYDDLYQQELAEIEKKRATVGNADLLMNIPILTISNMFELGNLYTRGFDSTRRQMGSMLNRHKLPGSLEDATIKSSKTRLGAITSGVSKSLTEGTEEMAQKIAADAAGEAVNKAIARHFEMGTSEESKTNVDDWIAGMSKSIADNLQDPHAWEEFMIGALSATVGMPVFGSQTKNAWVKLGNVGFAGGIPGSYNDYMEAKKNEDLVANYLNGRVKSKSFKDLYDYLRKSDDYQRTLRELLENGDKEEYKDLHAEKFFDDINAVASSGHLEEFKELINYNHNYTDEELQDIVKLTSKQKVTKEQDEELKERLEKLVNDKNNTDEEAKALMQKDLDEVNARLNDSNYYNRAENLEGSFVDKNGTMDRTDPDKMREILERNRENLIRGIDDFLRIRNNIDIETDGRLNDEQINLLAKLRFQMSDIEYRSDDMAEDLVQTLSPLSDTVNNDLTKAKDNLATAKKELAKAKEIEDASKREKAVKEAEEKVKEKQYYFDKSIQIAAFFEYITGGRDTSKREDKALNKGYGTDTEGHTFTDKYDKRSINSEEMQNFLTSVNNKNYFQEFIVRAGLDGKDTLRLLDEVESLHSLANKKKAYNTEVRKYLDPANINKAFEDHNNKVSKEQLKKLSDDFVTRIENVRNMTDLEQTLNELGSLNSEATTEALNKIKQGTNEDLKKTISDYEKGKGFVMSFLDQAVRLPSSIAQSVVDSVDTAWQKALNDGINTKDAFVKNLLEAAELIRKEGYDKNVADGIEAVLKELNEVIDANRTYDKVSKSEEPVKSEAKVDNTVKEDKEAIKKAIKNEVDKSLLNNPISEISKLSEDLKKRIDRYNEQTNDDKDKINDSTVKDIIRDLTDAYIISLSSVNTGDDTDIFEEDSVQGRSSEMKDELAVSFRSDHPAQYDYELSYKKGYEPTGKNKDQLTAVQEFLKAHNAYDFVDKNYLGYLWSLPNYRKQDIPIHLLKSTDDDINNGNDRIVFLAVKWEKDYDDTIREKVFNNNQNADLSSVTKLVQDKDGNEYQIVGVLSVGKKEDVSEEVGRAFTNLIDSLHDNEFSNANIEAAKKDEQFIVSDKTLTIKDIYTGRLAIRADENDNFSKKDSLYDFVKKSTEWSNEVNCLDFAIVSNGMLESSAQFDGEHVSPNSDWMQTHNGAVLLYIPRPDGKYYPVRCTRRSVADWLEKKPNDEYNTGEALLDAVIAGENDNEYLKSIIFNFNSLFDKDNGFKKFMDFKTKLSSFFIFKDDKGKPTSPIYVDNFGEDVVVKVYGEKVASIEEFFNVLAGHDVKFTLSLTYLKDNYTRKKERSLIESGVMEIGLRDFYNFNANFLLDPIDTAGNPLKINENPIREADNPPNIRAERHIVGEKVYMYTAPSSNESDDEKITYENGEEVTDPEEILKVLVNNKREFTPFVKTLDDSLNNQDVLDLVLNQSSELQSVFYEVVNGQMYVIDKRNNDTKIYKQGSKEEIKLHNDIAKEYNNIREKIKDKIKDLVGKNTGATDNLEDAIAASLNEEAPSSNNQKQGTFSGEIFLPLKGVENKKELEYALETQKDSDSSGLVDLILEKWEMAGLRKLCKEILFENADIGYNISLPEIKKYIEKYVNAESKEEREKIKAELKDKIECK